LLGQNYEKKVKGQNFFQKFFLIDKKSAIFANGYETDTTFTDSDDCVECRCLGVVRRKEADIV